MVGNRPRGVSIEGRVTIDTSGDMRRKIAEALHSIPPAVTVDFSGVTYLDTSGLATLLEASRIARQQGTRLVVEGLHDQPRELLHFTQIDRLLEVAEPEPHEPQDQPQAHEPKDQPQPHEPKDQPQPHEPKDQPL